MALLFAAALLTGSFYLPYWEMTLVAPHLPQGVRVSAYLYDIHAPLQRALQSSGAADFAALRDLARLETSLDIGLATVATLLVVTAFFIRKPWAVLLAVPALCFPLIVLADTAHSLSSQSALASPLLGAPAYFPLDRLTIGQVVLETRPGAGLILAAAASMATLVGFWIRYRNGVFTAGVK